MARIVEFLKVEKFTNDECDIINQFIKEAPWNQRDLYQISKLELPARLPEPRYHLYHYKLNQKPVAEVLIGDGLEEFRKVILRYFGECRRHYTELAMEVESYGGTL